MKWGRTQQACLPFARHAREYGTRKVASPFLNIAPTKGDIMVIGIAHLQPIVALVAGIAILIIPRLLNFIVAAYLIIIGITGLGLIK
jgi:hypothetical protein